MPRRVTSKVHDYFIYDANRSICQLFNKEGQICNAVIKGKHAGNLEKHVKTWHEDEWKHYWTDKNINQSLSENDSSNNFTTHFVNVDISEIQTEVVQLPTTPYSFSPFWKKRKLMDSKSQDDDIPSNIENAFIELVTVNGLPFSIVEESGIKKIISYLRPNNDRVKPEISILRLQKLIRSRADLLRLKIMEETKDLLVCLRIECATSEKKNYFSISISYRKKDKLNVIILGFIELPHNHSQDILKEEILNTLVEYNVKIDQIYYISVNNGSQVLKTTRSINDLETGPIKYGPSGEAIKTETDDYNGYDSDFDIFEVEETELDMEEDESNEVECDEEIVNNEATEKLVEDVVKCWSMEKNVIVSRNLIHILQNAILHTINADDEVNSSIKKIRIIVKKLRSHSCSRQLKLLRCKKRPILDCRTRFLSTLNMIERIIEMKPYIDIVSESFKEINISLKEWNILYDLSDALKPVKTTTSRLQQPDIPLSEFYKIWLSCYIKVKKLGSPFALSLCENMEKFRWSLFDNVAFKASLFMDPRFKNTLTSDDHEEMISYLMKIYNRLNSLSSVHNHKTSNSTDLAMNESQKSKADNDSDSGDDDLYQYMQSMVKVPSVSQEQKIANLYLALQTFRDSGAILELKNITDFWSDKKVIYADIHKLSEVIFSISTSSSVIENFVSQLKYICGLKKNSIEVKFLKDILLLRCNFELLNS